jgi:peroxin-2
MGQVNAEASSSRLPLAPKVAQVDADELDEGLVQMLGERVEKAVGNFKVPPFLCEVQLYADYQLDWTRDLKPEIGLAIKLVVFRYSFFGSNTASPGASLQNLKLVNRYGSRRRLSFH